MLLLLFFGVAIGITVVRYGNPLRGNSVVVVVVVVVTGQLYILLTLIASITLKWLRCPMLYTSTNWPL